MITRAIYITLIIAGGLFHAVDGMAQEASSIKVITRALPDSVILRWAPTSASAWKLLNKYGYKIERYTISRDGQPVEKTMVEIATGLKPAEQVRWEAAMERDDFVAISAQAIYGEEFQIDPGQSSVMDIYNKTKELDSRYSFALFAADLSPLAANLSGLRYVDKSAKENETYLYRVYSLVPDNLKTIEFGFAYSGPVSLEPLPAPRPPEVENKSETSVLIRWETSALRDIYIGYYLERSIDNGATFTKVNDLPMSVLSSVAADDKIAYSSKSDTLIVGQHVTYRIRGITSFGETGTPSDIMEFVGKHKFDYVPAISMATVINNFQVKLVWKNESAVAPGLSGYDLERSEKVDGAFNKVNEKQIEKAQTEFVDQRPLATNYYRLVAVSEEGQRNNSFPHMVQLEDSIPPLPPTGLNVLVDSTGKVTMRWNKNVEPDLLGYKVFSSRFKNSEFSQVTVSPVVLESFMDTLNIKTLSNRMYYKLAAVDTRFNTSGFSELFELDLPDVIPPVPPVITDVRSQKDGIAIRWIKSSSLDVKEHRIYRSSSDSIKWKLIKTLVLADTTLSHIDKPSGGNKLYKYAVVAVDRAGLQSPIIKTVTAKMLPDMERKGIANLKATANRDTKVIEVSWRNKEETVQKYLVYRSKDDEPLTLYSSVSSNANNFMDRNLSMGSEYSYRLKTLYKDGTESFFSDAVKVNY